MSLAPPRYIDVPHSAWPAAGAVRLAPGRVDLWWISLSELQGAMARWWATLSADERGRAARYRFERDRARFVAARGALRALLAGYIGEPAGRIALVSDAYGKPRAPAWPELRFNLSHAGERALYAVALGREVGVDIEEIRPELAGRDLAAQFFSAYELGELSRLPAAAWAEGFFNCWTRKEAYVKARGLGLFLDLAQFDVSLAPGEAATLLATRDNPAEAGRWSLHALDAGPGYSAALAVEGGISELRCLRLVDISPEVRHRRG